MIFFFLHNLYCQFNINFFLTEGFFKNTKNLEEFLDNILGEKYKEISKLRLKY